MLPMVPPTIVVLPGCCVFEASLILATLNTVYQREHWISREKLGGGYTCAEDPLMHVGERSTAASSADFCGELIVTKAAMVSWGTQ